MSQYTTETFQKFSKKQKQYDSNTERKDCKKDSYKFARDMKRAWEQE
jgi:hypothetical protein